MLQVFFIFLVFVLSLLIFSKIAMIVLVAWGMVLVCWGLIFTVAFDENSNRPVLTFLSSFLVLGIAFLPITYIIIGMVLAFFEINLLELVDVVLVLEATGLSWLFFFVVALIINPFATMSAVNKTAEKAKEKAKDKFKGNVDSRSWNLDIDIRKTQQDWEPVWDENGNRTEGQVTIDGYGNIVEVRLNGFRPDGVSFDGSRKVVKDGPARYRIVGRSDFRY